MVQAQLKVIKADGAVEEYLHTKVMGTINNSLGLVDQADIDIAEHFAEVVTFFLYHQDCRGSVTSGEILSIIKAILVATGYEKAAAALSEHHLARKLKRSRIEVVPVDIQNLADAELLVGVDGPEGKCRWDKSMIVHYLITRHDIGRQTARLIAAMVEEKVLTMGLTLIPSSLIRQLVLSDAATVLRAQQQLQAI